MKINDTEVTVKRYLPLVEKVDFSQMLVQQAKDQRGILNEVALNALFQLYLVIYYTDYEFSEEELADHFALYDKLYKDNVIAEVMNAIPNQEYENLYRDINRQIAREEFFANSLAFTFSDFLNKLPDQMEKVAEIVNNFDPEKYQNVIDFATAANGGRNINTNQPAAE